MPQGPTPPAVRRPTPLVGHYVHATGRSRLKTALPGTYHPIKFAGYGYCYLADAQFRFKRRYKWHSVIGMHCCVR